MLQKVVNWGDGMAFLALKTQQHRSSSEGLGKAPLARLWAPGGGEKYTVGKEQPVHAATCHPHPHPTAWMEADVESLTWKEQRSGSFLGTLEKIIHSFIHFHSLSLILTQALC